MTPNEKWAEKNAVKKGDTLRPFLGFEREKPVEDRIE